jgi:hypothetical protein
LRLLLGGRGSAWRLDGRFGAQHQLSRLRALSLESVDQPALDALAALPDRSLPALRELLVFSWSQECRRVVCALPRLAPQLTRLSAMFEWGYGAEAQQRVVDAIAQLTRLRRLRLTFPDFHGSLAAWAGLSALTRLDLEDCGEFPPTFCSAELAGLRALRVARVWQRFSDSD